MFCQNCGAELRLEAGFCAICGASAPRPQLHREPQQDRENKATRLSAQPQDQRAASTTPNVSAGSSLPGSSPATSRPAPQPDPRQIRSFQAIRQASGQRANMHSLPPVASLAVPASPPAYKPPQAPETLPPQPPAAWPAPTAAPAPVPSASVPYPAYPAPAHSSGSAPASGPMPGASAPQNDPQPSSNGYHPAAITNSLSPLAQANGHAPQSTATSTTFVGYSPRPAVASRGIHLPNDIPNRLALAAIAGMLLSFLLPWVIISGSRATPLSVGWPIIVPAVIIAAVGLTILAPERTLYARFFLALPFALGCFALGSAVIIFLVSTAIAANSVGTAFLGIDLGLLLFSVAALLLIISGYFKLLRELPLFQAGLITLAPLPGMLGRGAASPAPRVSGVQQPLPTDARPPA